MSVPLQCQSGGLKQKSVGCRDLGSGLLQVWRSRFPTCPQGWLLWGPDRAAPWGLLPQSCCWNPGKHPAVSLAHRSDRPSKKALPSPHARISQAHPSLKRPQFESNAACRECGNCSFWLRNSSSPQRGRVEAKLGPKQASGVPLAQRGSSALFWMNCHCPLSHCRKYNIYWDFSIFCTSDFFLGAKWGCDLNSQNAHQLMAVSAFSYYFSICWGHTTCLALPSLTITSFSDHF